MRSDNACLGVNIPISTLKTTKIHLTAPHRKFSTTVYSRTLANPGEQSQLHTQPPTMLLAAVQRGPVCDRPGGELPKIGAFLYVLVCISYFGLHIHTPSADP